MWLAALRNEASGCRYRHHTAMKAGTSGHLISDMPACRKLADSVGGEIVVNS